MAAMVQRWKDRWHLRLSLLSSVAEVAAHARLVKAMATAKGTMRWVFLWRVTMRELWRTKTM